MSVDPDDFVERRRHRIGASDVAAAVTGCFGGSAAKVIAGKLGLIEDQPTERMLLGLALEDRVIDAAACLLGVTVIDRQVEIRSPEWPWLVATCDALVTIPGDAAGYPLEVKTTSNPGGYPSDYLEAQLAVQMICCSVSKGFSAVRNLATGELSVREHRADPVIGVAVIEMGQALWAHLLGKELPSPCFPADADLWNRLHPRSSSGSVEIPVNLMADLIAARDELKLATNRADFVEAQIKELLGDLEDGTVDGVPVVRWRTVISQRVDLKALEADAPELVASHRTPSTARRFTLIAPVQRKEPRAAPAVPDTNTNNQAER